MIHQYFLTISHCHWYWDVPIHSFSHCQWLALCPHSPTVSDWLLFSFSGCQWLAFCSHSSTLSGWLFVLILPQSVAGCYSHSPAVSGWLFVLILPLSVAGFLSSFSLCQWPAVILTLPLSVAGFLSSVSHYCRGLTFCPHYADKLITTGPCVALTINQEFKEMQGGAMNFLEGGEALSLNCSENSSGWGFERGTPHIEIIIGGK